MAQYRCANILAPIEAAYLAGLIDGEGTITLSRRHRADHRQLVITISSTERNILAYVRKIVGTGYITNKRTYSVNHTPSVTYVITNRQALSVLQQIAPYLKSYKVDRAKLILADYVRLTPRNGRYTSPQLNEREAFITRFLELRPNQWTGVAATRGKARVLS